MDETNTDAGSSSSVDVDQRTLEQLHATLSQQTHEFAGEHAKAAAHMLADQQQPHHRALFQRLCAALGRYESARWLEDFEAASQEWVRRIQTGIFDEPVRVVSNAPLLSPNGLEFISHFIEPIPEISKSRAYLKCALVLAIYLKHSEHLNVEIRLNEFGPFAIALQQAVTIVELFHRSKEVGSQNVQLAIDLDQRMSEAGVKIANLEASLGQRRTTLEDFVLRLDKAQASQEVIDADLSDLPSKIAAVEMAMMAQLGLKETDKLWRREATGATVAYYFSLFVLLAVLIGTPILIYMWRSDLLSLITDFEAAAILAARDNETVLATAVVIGRLALIALPVALLIWAIKLVVRFNTRSMLLMDDARHRVAMLNTFLFLLKQEAATIQDRGALLEALFRRTPGHGPETVEPPNLTDLMKYGKEVGAKA